MTRRTRTPQFLAPEIDHDRRAGIEGKLEAATMLARAVINYCQDRDMDPKMIRLTQAARIFLDMPS